MAKSNQATQFLRSIPEAPALYRLWGDEDWGWKQIELIFGEEDEDENISFGDLGDLSLKSLMRSPPFLPIPIADNTDKGYWENAPIKGISPVRPGVEALVDFGQAEFLSFDHQPLEQETLWKDFAAYDDYFPRAVKLFSRYGYLIHRDSQEIELYASKALRKGLSIDGITTSLLDGYLIYAEPLERWYVEFDRLDFAKDVWSIHTNEEYTVQRKLDLLGERLHKFCVDCKRSYWPMLEPLLWASRWNKRETIDAQNMTDEQIIKNTRYDIHLNILSSLISYSIGDISSWATFDTSLKLRHSLIPKTLSSAIWIQLSEFISEGGTIKSCLNCQKAFVRLRNQHKDRAYCSNACKQKAWRNSPEQRAKRQKRDQP